ncbi:glycosyltransferase family 2 protein [Lutibacter citreus]|uniref:glycosyltransferase family 2 protein n=1 Tax=Lutibacter citreus TaxID=2138210 RepID=UPI000DBE7630|nr:glycosyltransferase [Lutibacter citreus]
MNDKLLVSICCITYNHEKFIKQCLDGFLMQQTNFEFEILIHDDASTDGTVAIISEYENKYPNIIKPIYQKENQFSQGINPDFTYNYPRAKGKYIAICEGDDYWTDPLKLQKQVDFLEANTSVVICGTQVKKLTKDKVLKNKSYKNFKGKNKLFFSRKDVLKHNPFDTCSVVFKNIKIPKNLFKNYNASDWVLYLFLLKKGKGCILNICTAVYNYHGNGIASSLTHTTYLQKRLKDILIFVTDNKKDKKIIKKTGLFIIWNYVKQAIRFKKEFIMALHYNRKLIIEFVLN